ncbi:MAG: hypothetical protein QOH00_481 [Gaiellales bacterium]|jgi:uncharacterized protein YkwD|nr:hypothetical protein [Gaiellales bacterium]
MRTILRSLLVSLAVLVAPATSQAATTIAYQAGSEQQVLMLLNQIRRQHGLGMLALSAPLRTAARGHSADMLQGGYFDHDSLNEGWDARISRYLRSSLIGETIARGGGPTGSPSAMVNQWMHSALHRRVILTAGFRLVGIGIATGAPGSVMATADFAA